jgi:Cdc6-like AAA superfamily ATPase
MINFVNGMYTAVINGKTVKRTKRKHLEYVLRKAGQSTTVAEVVAVKSEFTPMERFGFSSKFVQLLHKGAINSFIMTGSGGIGKTTNVTETLQNLGLREDKPEETGDYLVIRGFSTPRALYETLYNYNDKILILDDADQVFKDPLGANLLKAALDDKKERIITWSSSREDEEIPGRFVYTGKVIFISNLSINNFPQAIVSRSQKVDLTLTVDEKVEVIGEVFKKMNLADDVRKDVFEFVKAHANDAKDLNVRSAASLITLRENFGADWKRIAKYSFCG